MKLELIREKKTGLTYTHGRLYVNDRFFCDTLEDEDRGLTSDMQEEQIKKVKVYGNTAIPSGTYKIDMTRSNRFNRILPLLVDVLGYSGVRIHAGNTIEDTLGCILVGKRKGDGYIVESRKTENALVSVMLAAYKKEEISLTIKYEET